MAQEKDRRCFYVCRMSYKIELASIVGTIYLVVIFGGYDGRGLDLQFTNSCLGVESNYRNYPSPSHKKFNFV